MKKLTDHGKCKFDVVVFAHKVGEGQVFGEFVEVIWPKKLDVGEVEI